jgi:beta-glucosidase
MPLNQITWLLWLFSDNKEIAVSSNTHFLEGIKYRTVDKKIQEDAFKITLDGDVNSGVKIVSKSNFREDLRANLESESALQFSVKLTVKPSDQVMLSTYCDGESECGYSQNITEVLNKLPLDEWRTVSVELSCFNNNGMSFGDTIIPFELSSVGKLEISLADIILVPHQKGKAAISCNKPFY